VLQKAHAGAEHADTAPAAPAGHHEEAAPPAMPAELSAVAANEEAAKEARAEEGQ
jgi:hypothetical protein